MPVKPEEVYGRDKALFSLILVLYCRAVEVLFLYHDVLAWVWNLAGKLLGGYKDYEVRFILRSSSSRLLLNSIRKILHVTVFLGIWAGLDDIQEPSSNVLRKFGPTAKVWIRYDLMVVLCDLLSRTMGTPRYLW